MGVYISLDAGADREAALDAFLAQHGVPVERVSWSNVPDGMLPVCRVWNPSFSAAAVAYSEREMTRFLHDGTDRAKRWYLVPLAELRRVTYNLDGWIAEG